MAWWGGVKGEADKSSPITEAPKEVGIAAQCHKTVFIILTKGGKSCGCHQPGPLITDLQLSRGKHFLV